MRDKCTLPATFLKKSPRAEIGSQVIVPGTWFQRLAWNCRSDGSIQ